MSTHSGPVTLEHVAAEWILLALEHGFRVEGCLKPELESADAREERGNPQAAHSVGSSLASDTTISTLGPSDFAA